MTLPGRYIGATSEGFLVLGRTGEIRFANDSFRDFFSRSASFEQGELIPAEVAIDTPAQRAWAGDLAAAQTGQLALIAGDITAQLNGVWRLSIR